MVLFRIWILSLFSSLCPLWLWFWSLQDEMPTAPHITPSWAGFKSHKSLSCFLLRSKEIFLSSPLTNLTLLPKLGRMRWVCLGVFSLATYNNVCIHFLFLCGKLPHKPYHGFCWQTSGSCSYRIEVSAFLLASCHRGTGCNSREPLDSVSSTCLIDTSLIQGQSENGSLWRFLMM